MGDILIPRPPQFAAALLARADALNRAFEAYLTQLEARLRENLARERELLRLVRQRRFDHEQFLFSQIWSATDYFFTSRLRDVVYDSVFYGLLTVDAGSDVIIPPIVAFI